ncbi:unnamed protein product, partial [Ectocarpus sp. 8 AP-2014]
AAIDIYIAAARRERERERERGRCLARFGRERRKGYPSAGVACLLVPASYLRGWTCRWRDRGGGGSARKRDSTTAAAAAAEGRASTKVHLLIDPLVNHAEATESLSQEPRGGNPG